MDKLLLFDGHNLLFRMFFGIPGTVKNSKGEDIKAVIGFISSVIKYISKFKPDRVCIVFDSETSIADKSLDYSDYKSNRIDYTKVPDSENPFTQLPKILKILDFMGIPYMVVKDHEADDYIASICEKYRDLYEITIVSTDQDFFQLVRDNIVVFNPFGKEGTLYNSEKIYEKLGVKPEQIIEYKALMGDKSDNINGIRGVGPKTAQKILSFGSINSIIENKLIEEKLYNLIIENKEIIDRNIKLITMKRDISVGKEFDVPIIEELIDSNAMYYIKSCGFY
jgi:DNA polymerase-1